MKQAMNQAKNIPEQGAFRALADPTRRHILMLLSDEDMTIGEVSNQFDMTRGAIKKHLNILEEGHLISVRTKGRERINHLEPLGIKSAADGLNYFNQFWDSKLTALSKAINNDKEILMTEATITKSIFVTASRETVWAFLTQKEKLALWFYPAEADLVEGKPYALISKADDGSVTKQCSGNVLEMNKPSRLVYTFTIKPLEGEMTTVIWTLEEVHGGTKLSLVHEGIGKAAGDAALGLLMALDAGWDKHLTSLRSAVT